MKIVNSIVLTEIQSSSSKTFPRTQNTAVFSEKSTGRCWKRTGFKLRSSKIESSSCRCKTTSIGEKKITKKFVFRLLSKLQRTLPKKTWVILRTKNRRQVMRERASTPIDLWNHVVEIMMNNFWTSHLLWNKCVVPRTFEKQRGGNTSIHQNGDQRQQSLPSTSRVSTEQCPIGAKELPSRLQIILLPVWRDLLQNWMMSRNSESHPMFWS